MAYRRSFPARLGQALPLNRFYSDRAGLRAETHGIIQTAARSDFSTICARSEANNGAVSILRYAVAN
jgi:hypothetical protein